MCFRLAIFKEMSRQRAFFSIFAALILTSYPCHPHELTEYDYWEREQIFHGDSIYRFPHALQDHLPYMLSPGAKCNRAKHMDSRIYHHAIRHGLAKVTQRQFISILNNMCAMIPNFGVASLYQTFRCNRRRCDCPFEFLTWSPLENACKLRLGSQCGDVKVLTEVVRLEDVFGCEEGTKCIQDNSTDPYANNLKNISNSDEYFDDGEEGEEISRGKRQVKDESLQNSEQETTNETNTIPTSTEEEAETVSVLGPEANDVSETSTNNVSESTDKEASIKRLMKHKGKGKSSLVSATCQCVPGRACSTNRMRPPQTNTQPQNRLPSASSNLLKPSVQFLSLHLIALSNQLPA